MNPLTSVGVIRSTHPRARPAGPPAAKVRGRSGGVGRATSAHAEAVSDALRREASANLTRRRRQAGLMLSAVASMAVVTAYQTGVLRRLPDPPLPWVDSGAVDASGEAYEFLKTPDGALAIASYGGTLALVAMGGSDRAGQHPVIPLLATAKLAGDAAGAVWLTLEQATKHRSLCAYCLAASVATWAALPMAIPEARAAWRSLWS